MQYYEMVEKSTMILPISLQLGAVFLYLLQNIIMKHVRECSLEEVYETNSTTNLHVRMITKLAFLV